MSVQQLSYLFAFILSFCLGSTSTIALKKYSIEGKAVVCLGSMESYRITPPLKAQHRVSWSITNGIFPESNAFTVTGKKVNVIWANIKKSEKAVYELQAQIKNEHGKILQTLTYPVKEIAITPSISGKTQVASHTYATYTLDYPNAQKYEWKIIPPQTGSIVEYPQDHQVKILWHEVDRELEVSIAVKMQECGRVYYPVLPVNITNAYNCPPKTNTAQTKDTCAFDISPIEITAKQKACAGTPVQFEVTPYNPQYSYCWDFGDLAKASNLQRPIRNFSEAMTSVNVGLTITSPEGYQKTVTKHVGISKFKAKGSLTVIPSMPRQGETATIYYSSLQDMPSTFLWHQWVNTQHVQTFTTKEPYLQVSETGLYILDGKDANACTTYAIDRVEVVFVNGKR